MRKKIVAGNWKMNLNYTEAMMLTDAVVKAVSKDQKTNVLLAAPFIYLSETVSRTKENGAIKIAAQNCSDKNSGAFTGEVSPSMLASIGVDCVLIGHSERRNLFHEENSLLAEKVKCSLESSLIPVYCCGETLDQRNSKKYFEIVQQQLEVGLFHLSESEFKKCVIAYEPVWAIGTGVNATAEQAQEMHQFIRQLINKKYGESVSSKISILYGGSVTPANANDIFSCPDVDGGLVGGASLKANDFIRIVEAMEQSL